MEGAAKRLSDRYGRGDAPLLEYVQSLAKMIAEGHVDTDHDIPKNIDQLGRRMVLIALTSFRVYPDEIECRIDIAESPISIASDIYMRLETVGRGYDRPRWTDVCPASA